MKKLLTLITLLLFTLPLFSQEYVAANYYQPTQGVGLQVVIGPGRANNGGTLVSYPGGVESLTASTTNYVFLDSTASYAPTVNTTGFTSTMVPIAQIVTGGSGITTLTDARTSLTISGAAGLVVLKTGTASGPSSPVTSNVIQWCGSAYNSSVAQDACVGIYELSDLGNNATEWLVQHTITGPVSYYSGMENSGGFRYNDTVKNFGIGSFSGFYGYSVPSGGAIGFNSGLSSYQNMPAANTAFDGFLYRTGPNKYTLSSTYSLGSPLNDGELDLALTRLSPQLFAALPSCSSTTNGMHATVSDPATTTYGATLSGTGSAGTSVHAFCNGTNWVVD